MVFHIDVDAFFASVEQLRDPRLRGRPVAVGSGVIASCSYEARARGLANGMPLHQALRLCPDLVVLEGRHEIYRCFTAAIWEICRRYAPAMETFLDEAFCDFSGTEWIYPDFLDLGRRIRREVRDEVGLAVTVGIASNRMMSKIAAKSVKPDGLRLIPRGAEEAELLPLPIEKLPGMGPKTSALFRDMNVRTVREFREIPIETLVAMLGKVGAALHERARGRDTRVVREDEVPKSISRETTLHAPTADRAELDGLMCYLVDRAMRALRQLGLRVRTIRVSIRYSDWVQEERSASIAPTGIDEEVLPAARRMMWELYTRRVTLRHLGVVLSNFRIEEPQGNLFEDGKLKRLHEAVDRIRDKYGDGAVILGRAIELLGKLENDSYGYVLRTPSLTK
ncbi:MAG: DNA polymerase IV [Planctomycetes bacterium]|nr:DNA polymerase IV [Planctomycetota bacterium]